MLFSLVMHLAMGIGTTVQTIKGMIASCKETLMG